MSGCGSKLLRVYERLLLQLLRGRRLAAAKAAQSAYAIRRGLEVMLLTLAWGGCLLAGRCDLTGPGGTAEDGELSETNKLSFTATGVTTDEQTRIGARIMGFSCLPYLIIQAPLALHQPSLAPTAAAAGSAVSLLGFLGFGAYQVSFPWLQRKRIEEFNVRRARARALLRLERSGLTGGGLLQPDGTSDAARLRALFSAADSDNSGTLSMAEVRSLALGLSEFAIGGQGTLKLEDKEMDVWLKELDANRDKVVSEEEFVSGVQRWVSAVLRQRRMSVVSNLLQRLGFSRVEKCTTTLQILEAEALQEIEEDLELEENEEQEEEKADSVTLTRRAALMLLAGTGLVAFFADPAVGAVGSFSEAARLNAFIVAFMVTPLASNASELISSFIFAARKRKRTISLTFSQIYGAVTVNNTLCLGLFLAIVYLRGLTWDFSAEVTATVVTVLIVSALAGSRVTFPAFFAAPAAALYPLALLSVAGLERYLGWH